MSEKDVVVEFDAVPLRPGSTAWQVVDMAEAIDRFTRALVGGDASLVVGEDPADPGLIR
jgi:hypothetical protein